MFFGGEGEITAHPYGKYVIRLLKINFKNFKTVLHK